MLKSKVCAWLNLRAADGREETNRQTNENRKTMCLGIACNIYYNFEKSVRNNCPFPLSTSIMKVVTLSSHAIIWPADVTVVRNE
jgi:hypothetical protein